MAEHKPLDFQTGTWSSDRDAKASIIIAGDWAPIRDFAPLMEKDPEAVYGDLLPILRESDLSLVNLEAPLSDTGSPVTKSGAVFKGMARHVQGLAAVPFDAVTLANNHVFDFGLGAFENTLAALEAKGIKYTGAGRDTEEAGRPLVLEAKGLRVAVVNFSEGEDLTAAGPGPGVLGWDIPAVAKTIRELKLRVDAVIAVAHCGLEYIPFAPAYVIRAFKELAEAGADAVIGHHPHVPQGVFFHQGSPICCSLGNFVFYQPTRFFWRKLGYMVKLNMGEKGLAGLELIPYRIHDTGVSALAGEDKAYFFNRLKEISAPLSSPETCMDGWKGFLDHYGTRGFTDEVAMILDKLSAEPGKGAAMFRNRLTTAQHFHHWKDLLTRMVNNETGDAPQWAQDLAKEWLTRELDC